MKVAYIYILIIISFLTAQDNRSTIFSTGTPDTEEGYVISGNISIADRFSVSSDYAMEAYVAGYCNVTAAIDGVQFKFDSGDIDAGTFKLYGVV